MDISTTSLQNLITHFFDCSEEKIKQIYNSLICIRFWHVTEWLYLSTECSNKISFRKELCGFDAKPLISNLWVGDTYLNIVNNECPEAIFIHMSGSLVRTVSNVGHLDCATVLLAHTVINTTWFPPWLLNNTDLCIVAN